MENMTVDARPGSLTDMLRGCKIAPPKRINELLPGNGRAAVERCRVFAAAQTRSCAVNPFVRGLYRALTFRSVIPRFEWARTPRLGRFGYFRPAATWLIADLQSSLRLVRADLIQTNFAARRRVSAQRCFTSSVHTFAAAAVAANKS